VRRFAASYREGPRLAKARSWHGETVDLVDNVVREVDCETHAIGEEFIEVAVTRGA